MHRTTTSAISEEWPFGVDYLRKMVERNAAYLTPKERQRAEELIDIMEFNELAANKIKPKSRKIAGVAVTVDPFGARVLLMKMLHITSAIRRKQVRNIIGNNARTQKLFKGLARNKLFREETSRKPRRKK